MHSPSTGDRRSLVLTTRPPGLPHGPLFRQGAVTVSGAKRGTTQLSYMASKKSAVEATTAGVPGEGSRTDHIEERRRRRMEATTVDGTESFPPPGMDLPDGGVVPPQEDVNAS